MSTLLQHLRSGKLPAAVTLVLLSLMVLDLFVLEKKPVYDIVDNGTIDYVSNRYGGDHNAYYLLTRTHRRIPVSREQFNTILIDDTLSISQTPLFNRTARMGWSHEGRRYYQNINPMNQGYFPDILIALLIGAALLRLLNWQKLDCYIDYVALFFATSMVAYYLFA